jgi:hypothetical protein
MAKGAMRRNMHELYQTPSARYPIDGNRKFGTSPESFAWIEKPNVYVGTTPRSPRNGGHITWNFNESLEEERGTV